MKPKKILVIGGGISGLTLAYRLEQFRKREDLPFEIHLFEASNRLGGALHTEKKDGFLMEHGAESFFTEKIWGLDLAEQLGLKAELIFPNKRNARSFIHTNNRFVSTPKGLHLFAPTDFLSFLISPLLSLKGKFRAYSELWIPKKKSLQDETLAHFVRRRFGEEIYTNIAQPMLGGIYSGDPETLSLRATFKRFETMEEEHGSILRGLKRSRDSKKMTRGPRYHKFASFKDGMGTLIHALERELHEVHIHRNSGITSLTYQDNRWDLEGNNLPEKIQGDYLCLATSAYQASDLLSKISREKSDLLRSLPHETTFSLQIALKRSQIKNLPKGFGFVVPKKSKSCIIGGTFTNLKFKNRAPFGHTLLRIFAGGAFNRDMYQKSKEKIEEQILTELPRFLKIKGAPLFTSLASYRDTMPQYELGHLEIISELTRKTSPLFITGNYFEGVGIPDVIHHATKIAGELIEEIRRATKPVILNS